MPNNGTRRPVAERFWEKVRDVQGCWEWQAAIQPGTGYGAFNVEGKVVGAHRVAYELECGPIPDGLFIDHLCHNRACVNPDHLDVVTPRENIRRCTAWKHNTKKTHCPRGHEYNEANTYIGPSGSRFCRRCDQSRPRRKPKKVVA